MRFRERPAGCVNETAVLKSQEGAIFSRPANRLASAANLPPICSASDSMAVYVGETLLPGLWGGAWCCPPSDGAPARQRMARRRARIPIPDGHHRGREPRGNALPRR